MVERINKIFKAIQKLPENELTKTIIIPVLKRLGYLKVEFYGGQDEEGKDILCWHKDFFGDLQLSVAQVKHFKFTNKASGSDSFQTIINQLSVCLVKEVQYSDNTSHLPNQVILISSKEIDSKNIKSRFSINPSINDQKIKIIDGISLSELILDKCPSIASSLIGEEIDLSYYSSENLTNEILLKALGFHSTKTIKSIYTDIDFSLGKLSTRLFFNLKFNPNEINFALTSEGWKNFKRTFNEIGLLQLILSEDLSKIENDYSLQCERLIEWNKNYAIASQKLQDEELKLDSYKTELKNEWAFFRKLSKKINNLQNQIADGQEDVDQKQLYALLSEKKKFSKNVSKILKQEEIVLKHKETLDLAKSKKPTPQFHFIIDGNKISEIILEAKSEILSNLKEFNKTKPSKKELRDFLVYCQNLFKKTEVIIGNKLLRKALGVEGKVILRNSLEPTRFKLPVNEIFETNLNLILLGTAGAGKTTSLQMYALENKENEEKIILWIPLPNLLRTWVSYLTKNDKELNPKDLDFAICQFLISKHITLSQDELLEIFKRKRIVVLFDALDEAIKGNSWIVNSINELAEKYKSTIQIIVTSRMSGTYIDDLNFLAITLLPFTNEQRDNFIEKWFEPNEASIKINLQKHINLNESISSITRTPLLITTLCVLARHQLPLPKTEIKLYNDRLRLLTGYYDNVKNIPSRVTNTPQNLELLSKKIGFYLHSKSMRHAPISELEHIAIELSKNELSKRQAIKGVQELIDPCNVLVPMDETGRFGFGHLRYQEHLAALELSSNRSIPILNILGYSWWHETLMMMAEISESLLWLVEDVGHHINSDKYKSQVLELLKVRPREERVEIKKTMKKYEEEMQIEINDETFDIYTGTRL